MGSRWVEKGLGDKGWLVGKVWLGGPAGHRQVDGKSMAR